MRQVNEIVVKITRFGADTISVTVPKDSTVEEVLEEGGVTLASNESIWVAGVEGSLSSIMDDGDILSLVGKKEGGLK